MMISYLQEIWVVFSIASIYTYIALTCKENHIKAEYVPCVTILPPLEITWSKLCELSNPYFFPDNLKNKCKKWAGFPTARAFIVVISIIIVSPAVPRGYVHVCEYANTHTPAHSLIHTILYT